MEKPCIHGVKHVFDIGKVQVFAGPASLVLQQSWDLVIQMNEHLYVDNDPTPMAVMNQAAEDLFPGFVDDLQPTEPVSPTIMAYNKDFTSPPLARPWWNKLLQAIRTLPKRSRIAVCCLGGHGRTGTALAILAGLSGAVTKAGYSDPVAYVRKHYCPKAVESTTQINYITWITAMKVNAKPSFSFSYGSKITDKLPGTIGKSNTSINLTPTERAWANLKEKDDDDDGSYTGRNHEKPLAL